MYTSRRDFLKRVTSVCALGLMTGMQASLTFAENVRATLGDVKGTIVHKKDQYYESWRKAMTWYIRKPDRYPKTMVFAETVDDVIAAVNYARENDLQVSIRSTGHSISASPLRDHAVMIDLSRLRDAEIDAETQTAWVQPGMRSQEFMDLVNKEGLAFPTAHTSIVGLGGFLLGGGLGWNLQKWNISCRSVIGAEIVLADGTLVRISDSAYADLLWAIRGAGPGFFGVIVRYQVKLYAMPKAIKKSTYILTEEHVPMVANNLERLAREKDEKVEILSVIKHGADIPGMPDEGIVSIVSIMAFADTDEEADAILEPFASSPIAEKAHLKKPNIPHTFPELFEGQQITDATSPERTSIDNMWTHDPVTAYREAARLLKESPSKRSFVISVWGVNPAKRADTALPYFADHYLSFYALADKPEHVEPNYAWMDKFKALMDSGLAKGHYINETEFLRYPEHVKQCFTEEGWKRLGDLRKKYDPDGVFHTYIGYS
jgi:hypothetical protein